MNLADFNFTVDASSREDIAQFLKKCDCYFNPPLHTFVDLEQWAGKLRDNAKTMEMWHGEQMIAFLAYYCNDTSKNEAFGMFLAILREYRGQGVWQHFYHAIVDTVKKLGFEKLVIEVEKDNRKLLCWYLRMGFVEQTADDKHIVMSLTLK